MRGRFGVALGLVLIASATACGDDDEELTKAQFLDQVNAACKPFQDRTQQLFETEFPTSETNLKPFFEKLTPNVEGQVEAIKAVDPPEGEEDAVGDIVKAGEATVADFKKAIDDPPTAAMLFEAEGGENTKALEEKAIAFGLTSCVPEQEEEDQPLQDPSTFSPEKRAYVARADAICQAADDRLSAVEEETFETFPPPLEKWAVFLPAVVDIYGPALNELKAIPPPPADAATLSDIYADLESQLGRFREAAELAKAGKQGEFDNLIQPLFAETDETDQRQRDYGFQVCGSEAEDEGEEGE